MDLHADDDGAPGDHLASMILPGDFAPGELTTADLITVAPPHTNLNPETRYWIVISNEPQNNVLRISLTESKAEDSTSLNGWTISDRRARKEPDQPWSDVAYPIQMEVLGSAPFFRTDELAPLLVSNLGQSTGTLISADYDERTAQAFVAGPSRVGFDYRFQGIRVSASGVSTFNQFRMPQVRASLHRDGGGIPGARLHTLTMPDDFASTVEYEDYTLLVPPGHGSSRRGPLLGSFRGLGQYSLPRGHKLRRRGPQVGCLEHRQLQLYQTSQWWMGEGGTGHRRYTTNHQTRCARLPPMGDRRGSTAPTSQAPITTPTRQTVS